MDGTFLGFHYEHIHTDHGDGYVAVHGADKMRKWVEGWA